MNYITFAFYILIYIQYLKESNENGIVEKQTIDEWNSGATVKKQNDRMKMNSANTLPRKAANTTFHLDTLPKNMNNTFPKSPKMARFMTTQD